ncbi:DsrE family protein [Spiribacter halobius]|uniref:Uncharacterized protein n=1 Tax=Sediminicurvatus halobius TaxID=2182432 RepID=A0A2U2N6P4_9GAMM|nr:DsrE family protein [Spiribacter halobius]PWG64865.1 hypothetical protein DEM34_03460 [Spiribacter halobius]UEX78280.1 DsrE family protein [Spiribacter halobius]
MRPLQILFLAALLVVLAAPAAAQSERSLLTIVTSGEAETQAMALILTRQARAAGSDVRVLLCDAAGDLALRGATDTSPVIQPAGMSPAAMLRGLLQAGVTVEVCAIYLPNRSADEDDLAEGVRVARPDAIGALVADPAVRLFTF